VQFIDLHAQQRLIRKNIEERIGKVLDHGRYINGPEVEELEEKLAAYAGVDFAVGVGSGTDALLMSLMANGVGPRDAVLTSVFTFIATAEVIKLVGAVPVFVDIDRETYNIDPEKLDATVKDVKKKGRLNPRGIIPVDLFGQPADYGKINQTAEKHGLFVLEDAAQSFGASVNGRKSCALASLAATSFFPAKPLGCYGDGGMIFTNDEKVHEVLMSIRVHGQGSNKYDNIRVGTNGRLDTMQAAVLLCKFELFEKEMELRQKIASRYSSALREQYTVPYIKGENISSWAQYSILHPERERKMQCLKQKGIPSAIYYPKPLHQQDAFKDLGYHDGDFPVAERTASEIFSIPMHPYLSEDEQDYIVETLLEKY
jgi:UDP-2-acetamido-2-deoxy-ribo-hexuluronate aminotransferase